MQHDFCGYGNAQQLYTQPHREKKIRKLVLILHFLCSLLTCQNSRLFITWLPCCCMFQTLSVMTGSVWNNFGWQHVSTLSLKWINRRCLSNYKNVLKIPKCVWSPTAKLSVQFHMLSVFYEYLWLRVSVAVKCNIIY